MGTVNERRRYNAASSLIGCSHTQNDPWFIALIIRSTKHTRCKYLLIYCTWTFLKQPLILIMHSIEIFISQTYFMMRQDCNMTIIHALINKTSIHLWQISQSFLPGPTRLDTRAARTLVGRVPLVQLRKTSCHRCGRIRRSDRHGYHQRIQVRREEMSRSVEENECRGHGWPIPTHINFIPNHFT